MVSMRKKNQPDLPQRDDDWDVEKEDAFQDDLESITADLPVHDETENEAEDNPGVTPEEAMAEFYREKHIDPEGKETPVPPSLQKGEGKHKKKRKRDRIVSDVDTPSYEMSKEHPRLRRVVLFIITTILVSIIMAMLVYKVAPIDNEFLQSALEKVPETVSDVVSPVQNFFSGIYQSAKNLIYRTNYLSRLEDAYNELREENEQLVYQAMRANELQIQLSQFENMYDELTANSNLNPIICTVIGRSDGNYFSTFTINRGRKDGIEEYMAVTMSGALIGYTEQVTDTQSTVRTIIDSEASIAALIQSSRDQGTVRGTLGIDGSAMCRMFYLPDDHLPRPGDLVVTSGVSMSFPKGIPIGTVRESTRGMVANKQYIVVEPTADFQHIEYVIVLRYKPQANAIQSRNSTDIELVPLETARPYPTIRIGSMNYFETPQPSVIDLAGTESTVETPAQEVTPSPAPSSTLPPALPAQTDVPAEEGEPSYEYQRVMTPDPNVTDSPTPSPSPTPYITLGPENLTLEDED